LSRYLTSKPAVFPGQLLRMAVLSAALFLCGCVERNIFQQSMESEMKENDRVKYFPAIMENAWNMEIAGEKYTFNFDENNLCDLWQVAGKKYPVGTRAVCRNSFTLPEAGRVVLGMGCDWWMICRIDDQEVLNTFKFGNRVYPVAADNYVFEIDLAAGRHEVELEVKCGNLSFMTAFGNIAPADPTLLYEPLLTDFAPGRMSVTFVTVSGVPAAVDYRKKNSSDWRRVWHLIGGQKAALERVHKVELTDLEVDTEYEYRLVTEHPYRSYREDHSQVRTFRSAPESFRPFSTLIIGDTQGAWSDRAVRVKKIVDTEEFKRAELLGHIGDYCDSTADIERSLYPGLFDTFNGKPLLPVRGNHEYLGRESTLWFKYFGNSMKLMRYADVAFLLLDCGNGPWDAPPMPSVMNVPEPFWTEQKQWLEKAVADEEFKSARYRVVLAHGTPFGDASKELPEPLRKLIDPLFAGEDPAVKVDLWVGGHLHVPMRSVPGKNQFYSRIPLKAQAQVGSNYHFPIVLLGGPRNPEEPELELTSLELQFGQDGIRGIARDLNGDVLDKFLVNGSGSIITEFLRSDFKLQDVPPVQSK